MAISLLCSAAYLDRRREQQKTLVDLFLIKFLLTGGPLLASQITGMIMTFFSTGIESRCVYAMRRNTGGRMLVHY